MRQLIVILFHYQKIISRHCYCGSNKDNLFPSQVQFCHELFAGVIILDEEGLRCDDSLSLIRLLFRGVPSRTHYLIDAILVKLVNWQLLHLRRP